MAPDLAAEGPETRTLGPWRALLAGVLGFGYLYVGRMRTALLLIAATLLLLLVLAWTRLILVAEFVYLIVFVGFAVTAIQLVHPVLIAARHRTMPAKKYNRWWVYAIWTVGAYYSCNVIVLLRGEILGIEAYQSFLPYMSPTLEPGDMIIVDTWRYISARPVVGDIVMFRRPSGAKALGRIVGLPGDQLEIRSGKVVRNGRALVEPYLHDSILERFTRGRVVSMTLGSDEYYVLGDYRDMSRANDRFGPIDSGEIVGRVELLWFSENDDGIDWSRFPRYVGGDD